MIAEWGVGWMLSRIIGLSHANDLLFSARKFDGKEAERIGLVNKAIPADSFMDEVIAYAEDLSKECFSKICENYERANVCVSGRII